MAHESELVTACSVLCVAAKAFSRCLSSAALLLPLAFTALGLPTPNAGRSKVPKTLVLIPKQRVYGPFFWVLWRSRYLCTVGPKVGIGSFIYLEPKGCGGEIVDFLMDQTLRQRRTIKRCDGPNFVRVAVVEDFIYSMLVLDDLVFTGDGRGRVVCFDIRSNQKLYVLDAGQNAAWVSLQITPSMQMISAYGPKV